MMIITIDGVAASGKSSVASGVAGALGIPYVSSGLFYRAVTLLALKKQLNLDQLIQSPPTILELLKEHQVRLEPLATGNRVWLDGIEVTEQLHASRIDKGVSKVAIIHEVRHWVDTQIKSLPAPFVAEGRDMGTQVFPDTPIKFYLTASARVRATRRSRERPESIPEIEAALIERDKLDQKQSTPAPDAFVIDTSEMTLEEVVEKCVSRSREIGI